MQQLQRGSDDASTGSSEALGTANQQERGRCGARAGLEAVQLRARAETAYWTDWTSVDQAALEQSLRRYPAGQYPPLERYVRIAACLEGKDVRDVAFRVRWMVASHKTRRHPRSPENGLDMPSSMQTSHPRRRKRRHREHSTHPLPTAPRGGGDGAAHSSSEPSEQRYGAAAAGPSHDSSMHQANETSSGSGAQIDSDSACVDERYPAQIDAALSDELQPVEQANAAASPHVQKRTCLDRSAASQQALKDDGGVARPSAPRHMPLHNDCAALDERALPRWRSAVDLRHMHADATAQMSTAAGEGPGLPRHCSAVELRHMYAYGTEQISNAASDRPGLARYGSVLPLGSLAARHTQPGLDGRAGDVPALPRRSSAMQLGSGPSNGRHVQAGQDRGAECDPAVQQDLAPPRESGMLHQSQDAVAHPAPLPHQPGSAVAQPAGSLAVPVAAILQQNYAILCAFYANLGQHKADEDNDLLRRFRDNILVILNQINSASAEAMRHQS